MTGTQRENPVDEKVSACPVASRRDAEAFCNHCEWIHECWSMNLELHRCNTEENPRSYDQRYWDSPAGLFLTHHMRISNEYTLLQIAKLHDPKRIGGHSNLVIDFFVGQKTWSTEEQARLKRITSSLECFYKKHIRDARCKILAHNDLATYRNNTLLGQFLESDGEQYISGLAELANMIWRKWDCRVEHPWHGKERTFDFSPDGSTRREFSQNAKGAVACIQVGYSKLLQVE